MRFVGYGKRGAVSGLTSGVDKKTEVHPPDVIATPMIIERYHGHDER